MQFQLKTLLLLFVVVWASLAAFGLAGIALTAFVITAVVMIRVSLARGRGGGFSAILFYMFLVLLGLCFLPAVQPARESSRRGACANNLKQLALALANYESQYGCLPPAYVADAEGRPMHSWRVLILPFIEEGNLYSLYRFDEPWDGPNNRKLAANMPSIFGCLSEPRDDDTPADRTNYVAVVGPGTAWPGQRGRPLAEIRDKPSETILLVEICDSDIPWMEPRDLTLAEALGDDPDTCRVPTSRHDSPAGYFVRASAGAGNLVTVDGRQRFLRGRPSGRELAAVLSVDRGEPVAMEDLADRPPASEPLWDRLNWSHCIGLPLYIISLLALLCRPLPEKWRRRSTGDPR